MESTQNRQKNVKDEIEKQIKREVMVNAGSAVSMEDISRIVATMKLPTTSDMDMMAAEEAFNSMNSFYQVAVGLFMDNVPTLAVQARIIREVSTIFCPTKVIVMDPDMIQKVAGEDEGKTLEREAVLRRLAILEKGAQICKQYARRPQTSFGLGQKDMLESTSKTQTVFERVTKPAISVKEKGRLRGGVIQSSTLAMSGGSSVTTKISTEAPDTSASKSVFGATKTTFSAPRFEEFSTSQTLRSSKGSSSAAPSGSGLFGVSSTLQTPSSSKVPPSSVPSRSGPFGTLSSSSAVSPSPISFRDFSFGPRESSASEQGSSTSKSSGDLFGSTSPANNTVTFATNVFGSNSGRQVASNPFDSAASTK